MYFILALVLVLVAATVGTGVYAIRHGIRHGRVKRIMGMNLASFFVVMIGAVIFFIGSADARAESAADSTGTQVEAEASVMSQGMRYLAAALSTGLATIGCGIAVASAASAATGAISENDKLLGKTLIYVGLSEGIAIYGLVISILILFV